MEKWNDRHLINHVFFTDSDILRRNTDEYNDFWVFAEKYERFRGSKKTAASSSIEDNKFDLPVTFHRRYKINLALSSTTIKERRRSYYDRYNNDKKDDRLSLEDLLDFKEIILFYYDFLQKQKFSKLMKLKADQRNLPIFKYKEQIIYTVKSQQVVIIAGDTGCGKSTQVPQYLLAGGFSNIACTQPRKIACISLAKRVGFETLNEYKSDIAYQVRFETSKTKRTKVLFLTEGVLLRQFQSDPLLSMYNVIVVDEVHERNINCDFLLGVLKCLLQQRSDLRLILMSATINIELFANYFDSAPVIQVPGRLFPIDMQYLPHYVEKSERSGASERLDPSPYLRIMQLIDKKYPSDERGDLLIFLSGMSEISAVVDVAKEYALKTNSWIILPLHSALPVDEQDKIFAVAPEGVRKCIVSTNIAETSITIDGVRFVADSGKVKEMRFDPQMKMQRLQEFWISQASAEQRKGRAGRTGPGICFRLYSDADYDSFTPYSTSEIHRVQLDSLVLQMASLGLRDATLFPFIEPPPRSSLVNSIYLLKQQGALTCDGDLTAIGRMLAKLPVDITLGKMLIMGSLFSLIDPVLVITACLSVQNPLTKRFTSDNDYDCEHRRKELFSKHGDPFTLLNIYDEWILVKSDRKSNSRKWCKRRGVEEQRLYEISKLKQQFEGLLKDYGLLNKINHRDMTDSKYSKNRLERSQLIKLKREHRSQKSSKPKLKLPRMDLGEEKSSDSEDEMNIDINDIDFKLRHNLERLEASSRRNRRFTLRDINLLKLIISSGLFPQIVLPDESNPWRKQSEQVFHSQSKQFLVLHPTAVFSLQPDFLDSLYNAHSSEKKLEGLDTETRELLVFVTLLETNKPYVVNCMKAPALQTLFLLSMNIDTNSDCKQIVFDGWIQLLFGEDFDAKKLLCQVVQLRKAWDTVLEEKLIVYDEKESGDEKAILQRLKRIKYLEEVVSLKLAQFLDADISYKLRRLTSVDSNIMYVDLKSMPAGQPDQVRATNSAEAEVSVLQSGSVNRTKGGVDVTPYLTYGCIRDDFSIAVACKQAEYLVEHYHCPNCKEHILGTIIDRLKHNETCAITDCKQNDTCNDSDQGPSRSDDKSKNTSRTLYFCESCCTEFQFTPVEILKHKMSHK